MDVLLLVGASAFETPATRRTRRFPPPRCSNPARTRICATPRTGDGSIDYQEGDRKGELTLAILSARMHANGNISRMFAIGNSTVFTDEYIYQRTFNQEFILQLHVRAAAAEEHIAGYRRQNRAAPRA